MILTKVIKLGLIQLFLYTFLYIEYIKVTHYFSKQCRYCSIFAQVIHKHLIA